MNKESPAFSLVEVMIALGIISFCVISVFGLLPVALKSMREANDRRAAVEVMNRLAGDVVSLSGSRSSYRGSGANAPSDKLSGDFSDTSTAVSARKLFYENADGKRTNKQDANYVGVIDVVAPVGDFDLGVVKISVAWPAAAMTNASVSGWTNAQGSVTTVVYFNQ
jgi:type II secretory pathway pseudopilin PulG